MLKLFFRTVSVKQFVYLYTFIHFSQTLRPNKICSDIIVLISERMAEIMVIRKSLKWATQGKYSRKGKIKVWSKETVI